MKKKLALALLMATLFAGGAFAQIAMSAGAGAVLVPAFSVPKDGDSETSFGVGFNAFFDANYVELSAGMLFDIGKQGDFSTLGTYLTLGLIGKFPFAITESLSVFPFAGINFNIGLAQSVDGHSIDFDDPSKGESMNNMDLVFGGGVDFSITESLYIRGTVGFGITVLKPKVIRDMQDAFDTSVFMGKIPIKIAVGYKF
jgi:opacity protein-like surface antigen